MKTTALFRLVLGVIPPALWLYYLLCLFIAIRLILVACQRLKAWLKDPHRWVSKAYKKKFPRKFQ
jgi:hypothetical protein